MQRNTYILWVAVLLIAMSGGVWGQGSESFTNLNASASSYGDGQFTGNNSIEWIYSQARKVTDTSYYITDPSCGFKDTGTRYIKANISGGVGNLTYKTRSYFTSGSASDRTIQTYVGGTLLEEFTLEAMDTIYTRTINNINITGNVEIKFVSTGSKQIIIDDIEWTGYADGEPDPEPSNHVSDFTANANGYSTIDLTWLDNDGANVASGFLIMANTSGSFTDPVDGTPQADDTDLSDGAGVKNIASGVQAYTFENLTAETTYYFKIFPHSNSGDNIDYKTDGTVPTASATTDEAPPLFVINEILADPNGDANGDGTVNTDNDEFVEIVNRSGSTVDISGWQIYDAVGLKHTIPEGTTINDNVAIVIFGGGTPTGIPGIVQVASVGYLQLNNTGDDVILKDTSGVTVASYTYGSEGGDNQSIARNPDFTGNFVKHTTITENPVSFSPGKMNAVADQSLPVELQKFNAIPGNGEVTLCWTTESETENLGFIVSRKSKGESSKWEEIASYVDNDALAGHGSTSEAHEYTYTDAQVVPGVTYFYRLGDVDYAGKITWHKELEVTLPENGNAVPAKFTLHKAYPNPFNPETTFAFELGEAADVHVRVYDLLGNLVTTLTDSHYPIGQYRLHWDGRDNRGRLLSTGIYFLHISSGTGFTNTQKVIFLR